MLINGIELTVCIDTSIPRTLISLVLVNTTIKNRKIEN